MLGESQPKYYGELAMQLEEVAEKENALFDARNALAGLEAALYDAASVVDEITETEFTELERASQQGEISWEDFRARATELAEIEYLPGLIAFLDVHDKLIPGELVKSEGDPIDTVCEPPSEEDSSPKFWLKKKLHYAVWTTNAYDDPHLTEIASGDLVGREEIECELNQRMESLESESTAHRNHEEVISIAEDHDALGNQTLAQTYREMAITAILSKSITALRFIEIACVRDYYTGSFQALIDSTAKKLLDDERWATLYASADFMVRVGYPHIIDMSQLDRNEIYGAVIGDLNKRAQELAKQDASAEQKQS